MDHPEIPEPLRQVAPCNPGAVTVQYRFDKQPVILRRPADMSHPSGQKIINPITDDTP